MSETYSYGVYKCQRCAKGYTVLDSWDESTPEFCAPCLKHLKSQFALVPVDKDGKDVPQ